MKYRGSETAEAGALVAALASMPAFLETSLGGLSPEEATVAGPRGAFSPVEHCWHLADLECEGYGVRIRRLLAEDEPDLPDFDGDRIARERDYRSRALDEGLRAFRAARATNLERLRDVAAGAWQRGGRQEGVGRVALCDLPTMMAEHDAAHRAEIETWLQGRRVPTPG